MSFIKFFLSLDMNKIYFFVVLLFFNLNATSQTDVDLGLNMKKKFVSLKTIDLEERALIMDFFITDNDTLVSIKDKLTKKELDLFCECYTNDSLTKKYNLSVFIDTWKDGKYLSNYQWTSKINVYFDKQIPIKVKKDFISFFEPLNNIDNLEIDFVKKKENANYLIKTSDTLIPNNPKYGEAYNLSKATYNMLTDKNKKFYGGEIIIDLDRLNDKSLLLPKLKQLFFTSLGQFATLKHFTKTSLLSIKYEDDKEISDEDIQLLKMHYIKIFDEPFTLMEFYKLTSKFKSICKNE